MLHTLLVLVYIGNVHELELYSNSIPDETVSIGDTFRGRTCIHARDIILHTSFTQPLEIRNGPGGRQLFCQFIFNLQVQRSGRRGVIEVKHRVRSYTIFFR